MWVGNIRLLKQILQYFLFISQQWQHRDAQVSFFFAYKKSSKYFPGALLSVFLCKLSAMGQTGWCFKWHDLAVLTGWYRKDVISAVTRVVWLVLSIVLALDKCLKSL